MKRYFFCSLLLLTLVGLVVSCKSDDTTEAPNSYCYISSFTLGTLTRTVPNGDETTTVSYNGSYYPMSIDQRAGIITNRIPLLTNTDLSSVTASISARGVVTYFTADGTETAYSSSARIDFTQPVHFRVTATDLSGSRDYIVTVVMREKEEGSYDWEPLTTGVAADREVKRALTVDETIMVWSTDATGNLYRSTLQDQTWGDENACTGATGAMLETLQTYNGQLWMSTTDSKLLTSADGIAWTKVAQAQDGDRITLMGASKTALYARVKNILKVEGIIPDRLASSQDGMQWTTETMEKDLAFLPIASASVSFQGPTDSQWVIIGGVIASGDNVVWKKDETYDEVWTLMGQTGDHPYVFPWQTGTIIVRYHDMLIAMSGNDENAYVSHDNGITWKKDEQLQLPLTDPHFAATVQGDYIYIFGGSQAQRAHINL